MKHEGDAGEILLDPLAATKWCFNTASKPPAKGKAYDGKYLEPKNE